MSNHKEQKEKYISLQEAAKVYGCTQKHMNLVARQGKLRAIKMGRNWVTTSEWLDEYAGNSKPFLNNDKYISLREAARAYGCTQRHLNLMSRNGKLKATKVGRNWVTTFKWLEEYSKSLKTKKKIKKIIFKKPSPVFKKAFATCLISFLVFLLISTAFVAAKQGGLSLKNPIKHLQSPNFISARAFYSTAKVFDLVFHPYYEKYLANVFTDIKVLYGEHVEPIDQKINQKVNQLVWEPLGIDDIAQTIAKGFKRVDRISNQFFGGIFASVLRSLGKGWMAIDNLLTKPGQLVINIVESTANFVKKVPSRITNFAINAFSTTKKIFVHNLPQTLKNLFTLDFLIPTYQVEITDQSFISIKDLYKRLSEMRDIVEGKKIVIQEMVYQTIKEVIVTKPVEIQVIKDEAVLAAWKAGILSEVDSKLSTLETTIYETTHVENIYYYAEAAKAGGFNTVNNEVDFNEDVDMNKNLTVVGSLSVTGGVTFSSTSTFTGAASFANNLTVGGDLTVDTNTLYVDSTNNYVGINTLTPSVALAVLGTASISQDLWASGSFQFAGGEGTATISYSRLGSAITTHSLSNASDLIITGLLEVDDSAWFDSTVSVSNDFEVGSNILFVDSNNGYVGINDNSPAYYLAVDGTASISDDFYVGDNLFFVDVSASNVYASASFDIASLTDGTLTIDGSGNITGGDYFSFTNASASENIEAVTGRFTTIGSDATLTINAFTLGGDITGANYDITGLTDFATIHASISDDLTISDVFTARDGLVSISDDFFVGDDLLVAHITDGGVSISGDFEVTGDITLGSTITNILTVNSYVGSDLIPESNNYSIGTTDNRWVYGYFDEITVATVSATGTDIGGTTAAAFLINSDNSTDDAEDAFLTFERGTPVTNASLKWDSTNTRFNFNFATYIDGNLSVDGAASISDDFYVGNDMLFVDLSADEIYSSASWDISEGMDLLRASVSDSFTVNDILHAAGTFTDGTMTLDGSGNITGLVSLTSTLGTFTHASISDDLTGLDYLKFENNALIDNVTNAGVLSFTEDLFDFNGQATISSDFQVEGDAYFSGAFSMTGGNLDMNDNLILNIGNAGTDFTTGGGLNLASGSNIDSGTLYVDAGANRVGIGTINPAAGRLEIEDNGATNPLLKVTADDGNPYGIVVGNDTYSTTDTHGLILLVSDAGLGYVVTDGTNSELALGVGGAEKMRIDSSGNVGIGTTNPSESFHIEGGDFYMIDTTGHVQFRIGEGLESDEYGDIRWDTVNNYMEIDAYDSMPLVLQPDNGNVGIGTGANTINYKLSVDGTASISDSLFVMDDILVVSNSLVGIGTTDPNKGGYGSADRVLTIGAGLGNTDRGAIELSGFSSITDGGYQLGTIDFRNEHAQTQNVHASIREYTDGHDTKGALTFWTSDGTTLSEEMRITNDGNVGIGTTNPSTSFHVFGDSQTDELRVDSANARGAGIGFFNDSAIVGRAGSSGIWLGNTTSDLMLGAEAGKALRFFSGGSSVDAMYIDTSSNIGIGTSNPSESLHLVDTNNTAAFKMSTYDDGDEYSYLDFIKSDTDTAGDWLTTDDGDVLGQLGFYGVDSGNVQDAGAYIKAVQDGDASTYVPTTLSLWTYGATSTNTNQLVLASTSYVGIGTGEPGRELDVFTDTNQEGVRIQSTGDTYSVFEIDANRSGADAIIGRHRFSWNGTAVAGVDGNTGADTTNKDDGYLSFWTAPSGTLLERMRIDSAGNVGIGTTNPSSSFHVVDSTDDTDFIVDTTNGRVGIGTIEPLNELSFGTSAVISTATSDGSDTQGMRLAGGGIADNTRGAMIQVWGNEHATLPGQIYIDAGNVTDGNIYLRTGDYDTRVYIDDGGNVGIGGDTNPSYTLSVDGTASISDDFYVTGDDVLFQPHTTATDFFQIASSGWTSGDDYGPIFNVDSTNDRIGVGTTGPGSSLDVYHATLNYPIYVRSGDATSGISWEDDSTTGASYVAAGAKGDDFFITAGGSEQVRVDTTGLGIGDTSPQYKLSVDGTASISDSLFVMNDMLVVSNSMVGIGTTDPAAPLSVKGTALSTSRANTTGILVDSSGVTSGAGNFGVPIEFGKLGATFNVKEAAIAPVQEGSNQDTLSLAFFVADDASAPSGTIMEAMRIKAGGNVGIGDTNPAYTLSVDGTASVSGAAYFPATPSVADLQTDANGQLINGASDIRLKKNVADIENALDKLLSLRGVYFNWKSPEEGNDYSVMDDTILHMGFIAQEVATSSIPELAYVFEDDIHAVRQGEMVALLVEGVKEQQTLISPLLDNITVSESFVEINNTASISGDLYVSGKIFADGGIDPPYMMYDIMSRERIRELAQKIPESKRGGAMTFYNGETGQLEAYFPEADEFSLVSEMDKIQEQIDELQQTQDEINQELDFANDGGFTASVSSVFNALKELGVTIANGVITAVKLVVDEVVAKVVRANVVSIIVEEGQDNVVGTAIIPAQSVEYRVENSLVQENSKIFVSFISDTGGKTWHISERIQGVGFTIRLSNVTPEELEFDYWILLIEDEQRGTTQIEPASQDTQTNAEPYCGDGEVYAGEECDDGNVLDGDGCSATCMVEHTNEDTNESELDANIPLEDTLASSSETPIEILLETPLETSSSASEEPILEEIPASSSEEPI